jgi:hypothetical protein
MGDCLARDENVTTKASKTSKKNLLKSSHGTKVTLPPLQGRPPANIFARVAWKSAINDAPFHLQAGCAFPRNSGKDVAARSAAPLRRNRRRMPSMDVELLEVFEVFVVQFFGPAEQVQELKHRNVDACKAPLE